MKIRAVGSDIELINERETWESAILSSHVAQHTLRPFHCWIKDTHRGLAFVEERLTLKTGRLLRHRRRAEEALCKPLRRWEK